MPRYRIEISRTAEKQFRKLGAPDRSRIAKVLAGLGDDPYPPGSRRLSGYTDVFRVRAGVFRVLYSVEGRKLIVIILKIGPRKDVYR